MDVGSGYIGMSSYHPVLVSALILLNTFGMKVLAVLALLSYDGSKVNKDFFGGGTCLALTFENELYYQF